MKRIAFALLLAAAAGAQAQQVYRIVGPDGRVTFSDRPATSLADQAPAGTATPVDTPAASVNTAALPYELRQVVQRYPVTLYTSDGCAPCNDGRSLLRSRGVPFVEKTVTTAADSEALTRISGGTSIPFATIGAQALQGFSSAEWSQYLDLAGYPKQSQLPATYRAPPAAPLVTVAAPRSASPAAAAGQPSRSAPSAPPRNPAGIQF
ncbi:DUF4124 domain-containing protein [Xylophilus rhododendri]|uniref:DUF4124 domain-containing protein n=1 Tax=Xylophilus rhododendri TaxID=2697032 RepID=A0A857J211_9BURK|nr:glutaredoxin family protein [Xylophilus rhododendri]QHI97179.1 DUF4124 domain-containing protein [Xylophilus rhododendri]